MPPLNIFREGGQEKIVHIILNHEKTTWPIQDIFGVNLGAFFSVRGKFVWEKSEIYISGEIFFFLGGAYLEKWNKSSI